ncbi:hypothetical protein [Thioclava nitratireducens]|uniref:hypothetical protein n=1 Tax=Thioclava nitratireducens TaxID=1915078 RepID=UPI00247FC1ED|nr:hypothetical protein [Thioclava nitratireducens]WGT50211.1 hypothetical protein P0N61_18215 [Thioclava nitratireducens]
MATDRRPAILGLIWLSGFALGGLVAGPAAAQSTTPVDASATTGSPMSAIDWLSHSLATTPRGGSTSSQAPVTGAGGIEDIAVLSLDAPSADSLGLLTPDRTGLPRDLWGKTPEPELAQALRAMPLDQLPALQGLSLTLLLAELNPPQIETPAQRNQLFLARIDRLLDMGALEQANALLGQAGTASPEIFRRSFDVALLLGQENRACKIIERTPGIAPSYAARVFCLARNGQWDTAELTYGTGSALGQIPAEDQSLLEQFLDPALAEEAGDAPPPDHVTPLAFKMMEAIGQPLPTATLPLAFAQADLTENNGWKSQLEAAERLARAGVLDPNQLLGLYTERKAAASGALWDRVSAVSALDDALESGKADAIATALPAAYDAMAPEDLVPVLGTLFGDRLAGMDLPGRAGRIAYELSLLTPNYEENALKSAPQSPRAKLLKALAAGDTGTAPATGARDQVLKSVFDASPAAPPARYESLLPDQLGLALIEAISDVSEGSKGDYPRLREGLSLLRLAGLETVTRRAAIEMIVLGDTP